MKLTTGSQVYDEETYQSATALSRANAALRADMASRLRGMGLSDNLIETALAPLAQVHAALDEEIKFYEGVRRLLTGVPLEDIGDVIPKLRKLGHLPMTLFAREAGITDVTAKKWEDARYQRTPLSEVVNALTTLGYTATVTLRHTNGKDAS